METTIKEISRIPSGSLKQRNLVMELTKTNPSIVNSFRRMALDHVPTYAFHPAHIKITKNTSIFDNDYMTLRLSQLTIPNIDVPVDFLDYKYWDVDYEDPNRETHPDDTLNLEMFINAVNNTHGIKNITTNDATVFINGNQIEEFDKKYPHLLIQLKPQQEFNCVMRAQLGIGKKSNIFAAAGCAYFDEVDGSDETSYIMSIESQGQLSEREILIRCCNVILKKMEYFKEYFEENIKDEKILEIDLNREDHAIGNIINEFLQERDDIIFSGLCKPDLLVDSVRIKVQSKKEPIKKHLIDVMDDITKLYTRFKKDFTKLDQ